MSDEKKFIKRGEIIKASADDSERGSSGGQTGQIEFKDFLAPAIDRDDLLSPAERKRLLAVHRDLHENIVKKTKIERENRAELKDRKANARAIGLNAGMRAAAQAHAKFITHPNLNVAQFQGADKQVTMLPSDQESLANEGARNELELQLSLQNRLTPQPTFNPRPLPR